LRVNRREWILILLILVLAAALRLTRLGLVEFKYDEATTARSALAIAREGQFPAFGMVSSWGPHNPPLMSYLLAPAFAVSRDPRLATGWVAFLGVAAVGLTYWIGRTYFGRRVATLAAVCFAASPWAVFHSRKIWAQNVPLFTLLFVASLLAFVVRRKPWALCGAFASAACLVGFHLGGLAFFVILALVAAAFFRRVHLLPLLAGIGLAVFILSPCLLFEVQNDWPNLRALLHATGKSFTLDLESVHMAALNMGGLHFEDLAGERHADFIRSIIDLRWFEWAEVGLFWIGLVWMAWRVIREAVRHQGYLADPEAARMVLLVWWAVPVAALVRHSDPIYPHALSLLYPVQHLIVALLVVDWLAGCRRRWGQRWSLYLRRSVVVFAMLLVAWQAYLFESLLTFVEGNDTPGGYGTPIKYTLAVVRRVQEVADGGANMQVVAVLPGADPRYDGQAAAFDVLLEPGRRLVDGRSGLVLAGHPTVYLVDSGAQPGADVLADLALEMESAMPVRTGSEAVYRFYRWQPSDVIPRVVWDSDPVRWASGVELIGYDWTGDLRPGGRLRWTLYWRVSSEPPVGQDYHWFNHLLDGDGNRWGQADGAGFAAADWQVGDVVLTWFDIDISPDAPPPPYSVRVGMYSYPDIANVQLIDVAGNPAGEFVEMGPIDATP